MTWQENLKADYIKSVKSSIQQLSDFLGERKFLAGEKVQHQNDDCVSFQVTVKSVKKQEYITHKNLACISKAIACVLQQKQTWDTLCIISWLYLYQSNMSNMTMYAHSLVYKYTHNCSCHKVWKFFCTQSFQLYCTVFISDQMFVMICLQTFCHQEAWNF